MAKISFFTIDGDERSYKLHPQIALRIGRDPGNDVVLRDAKVSRRHAQVVFEKGFFVIHDLDSANGTYVNGRRVRVAPLTDGAQLKLGNTQAVFSEEVESQPRGTVDQSRRNPLAGEPMRPRTQEIEMPPEALATYPHEKGAARPVRAPSEGFRTEYDYVVPPSVVPDDSKKNAEVVRPHPGKAADQRFTLGRYVLQRVSGQETATIKDAEGSALFFYRRTFNAIGVVAAVVSSMVLLAGGAVAALLLFEGRLVLGLAAVVLTALFTAVILLLVPPRSYVLYSGESANEVALVIAERSRFGSPVVSFAVTAGDGRQIGFVRRNFFTSLFGRAWRLVDQRGVTAAIAREHSRFRGFMRRFVGDFFGLFKTDYVLTAPPSGEVARLGRQRDGEHTLEIREGQSSKGAILLAFAFLIESIEKTK